MVEFDPLARAYAEAHARTDYPRESCGVLIVQHGRQRYFKCRNLATGSEHFAMSPEDFAYAEDAGEVVAVVHSHPDAPATPSEHDRVVCEETGLPWFIVSARLHADDKIETNDWASLAPSGYQAPLVGRTFSHGSLDCYSLIRDYYKRTLDITIPDYPRRDEWWKTGQDLYSENFAAAGFRRLAEDEPMQPGDVFLAQIRSPVANHGGIYLGHNLILHHLHGRLSSRDVWGGYIKECTVARLRYVGAPNE